MILNQTEHWVDVHGVMHPLNDMDPSYRANTLAFIRRRAQHYQDQAWADYLAIPIAFEDDFELVDSELQRPPEVWVESTPLVRRLVELEKVQPIGHLRLRAHNRWYGLTHPGWRRRRDAYVNRVLGHD